MVTNFKWSAEAPTAKPAKTKTDKPRGHNPPGARTRNEPKRIVYKDPAPMYNYRKPKSVPQADTPELRAKVAAGILQLVETHDAYLAALKAFGELGPLPDGIINDMPTKVRRHMRLYKMR